VNLKSRTLLLKGDFDRQIHYCDDHTEIVHLVNQLTLVLTQDDLTIIQKNVIKHQGEILECGVINKCAGTPA
jgi:hypothetical protein